MRALTGSPGRLRVGSTGFMRTEFTDDPLARFGLPSSACDAPAALPSALALERSAPTARWLDACAPVAAWLLRADAVAANSTAAAARQGASEMWRIGMGRGGKSCALSAGQKVLSHRILSKAPWAVNGQGSATRLLREAG